MHKIGGVKILARAIGRLKIDVSFLSIAIDPNNISSQVAMACIQSLTGSNFGQIGPPTSDLASKIPLTLTSLMRKLCLQCFWPVLEPINF